MSKICTLCQSSDHIESEDNLVICKVCGVVISEEIFADFDETKDVMIINSNEYCNLNKHSALMKQNLRNRDLDGDARKQAKQILEHCMAKFRFSSQMRKDADKLFIQIINSRSFFRCATKTKILLAGVCAYLEMIKFDYVITKNVIAKTLECTVFEFGAIYKRVIKETKISMPKHFFTIDQHITTTVSSIGFDADEQMQIEHIVFELINFQRQCTLIDSLCPINVILATSYFAWKCVKYLERSKVFLTQFLVQFKIKSNLFKHSTKLIRLMIELCKLIPWVVDKRRMNRKTIFYYTHDLLEHPNTVLADYLKQRNIVIDRMIIQQEERIKHREKLEAYDFVENDCLNGEISLKNISDAEIDSYIRSDEEVRMLKKIRKSYS